MRSFFQWGLLVGFFIIFSFPAQAFESRIGARTLGMGDAFTALADDFNSLNYNPAGLALEKNLEVSLEYANLYYGLNDGGISENNAMYAQPLNQTLGIGFAWNNLALPDIYTENEFVLGCGIQPSQRFPFYAGLSGKLFYLGYTDVQSLALNPYFQNSHEKYQFGVDLGMLFQCCPESRIFPGINLGFSALNLNQPDLGLNVSSIEPVALRLGTAVVFREWDSALDLVLQDSQFQVHWGVEKWFENRLYAIRAGFIGGQYTSPTFTAGASYAFDFSGIRLRLNYAFNYALGGILETSGTHRASLDFAYGLEPKAEAFKPEKDLEEEARSIMSELKQNVLVQQAKEYLREKVIQYLTLRKTLAERRRLGRMNAEAEAVDQMLTQARNRLADQDVNGFLDQLKLADERFQKSEPAPANSAPKLQ